MIAKDQSSEMDLFWDSTCASTLWQDQSLWTELCCIDITEPLLSGSPANNMQSGSMERITEWEVTYNESILDDEVKLHVPKAAVHVTLNKTPTSDDLQAIQSHFQQVRCSLLSFEE